MKGVEKTGIPLPAGFAGMLEAAFGIERAPAVVPKRDNFELAEAGRELGAREHLDVHVDAVELAGRLD